MSTQPDTPAPQWRPITPDNQPVFPCWLWHSGNHLMKAQAQHSNQLIEALAVSPYTTHWHRDQPTAPTAQPEQPAATGTPRTDAFYSCKDCEDIFACIKFARQLERKLAEARAEYATSESLLSDYAAKIQVLERELTALRGLLLRTTGSLGLVIAGANPKAIGHENNYSAAKQYLQSHPVEFPEDARLATERKEDK